MENSRSASAPSLTGKEADPSSQLTYFGYRYYMPGVGRWASVDPLADNQPGWSPYAYVFDNPAGLTDPDGRCVGDLPCPKWFVNAVAGFGDAASFGLSAVIRHYTPGGDPVDYGSWSYAGASLVGTVAVGVLTGGASEGASAVEPANALRAGEGSANALRAGEAGSYSELQARGVVGDELTPHHMPQAAAGYTSYNEGGTLAMEQGEHVLTRTYGFRGAQTLRADAGLTFREVLVKDIQDVRSIVGSKYNAGLRRLVDYYRTNFPELMGKGGGL